MDTATVNLEVRGFFSNR